jgi:hypothetical protein
MDQFPPALPHGRLEQIFPDIFFVTGAMKTVLSPFSSTHEKAPQAKLAFNSQPADSDKAALRWLPTSPGPSE